MFSKKHFHQECMMVFISLHCIIYQLKNFKLIGKSGVLLYYFYLISHKQDDYFLMSLSFIFLLTWIASSYPSGVFFSIGLLAFRGNLKNYLCLTNNNPLSATFFISLKK